MRSWKPNCAASAREVRRSIRSARVASASGRRGWVSPLAGRASLGACIRRCMPARACRSGQQRDTCYSFLTASAVRDGRARVRPECNRRPATPAARNVEPSVVAARLQCALRHSAPWARMPGRCGRNERPICILPQGSEPARSSDSPATRAPPAGGRAEHPSPRQRPSPQSGRPDTGVAGRWPQGWGHDRAAWRATIIGSVSST